MKTITLMAIVVGFLWCVGNWIAYKRLESELPLIMAKQTRLQVPE